MNQAEPTEQSIMGKKHSPETSNKIPAGATSPCWTLNAGNGDDHHGLVSLSKSPLYLDLNWCKSAADVSRHVGIFRLDLQELLEGDYIQHPPTKPKGDQVRLRIVRSATGEFFVQKNNSGPEYPLNKPII